MIHLVRSAEVVGDWEKVGKALNEMLEAAKAHEKVRESYLMFNVTGLLNEVHWVLTFDSLADEDAWAASVMGDEGYIKAMTDMSEEVDAVEDNLYRRFDEAWSGPATD